MVGVNKGRHSGWGKSRMTPIVVGVDQETLVVVGESQETLTVVKVCQERHSKWSG